MKGLTMPFVELFAPKGALDTERGRRAKSALVSEVMRAEGAPDTQTARDISWLVVTEPDAWFVGGEPAGDGPPRFVVRVSVPAGSLDEDKRLDLIQRVTRVLADAEDEPDRLYETPAVWVHINEVPEGNWGAFGRVVRLSDIIAFATEATVPA
jgi:phenylpyruvate tautomerase PptA (4-oxalocrotonate tautomerase family)